MKDLGPLHYFFGMEVCISLVSYVLLHMLMLTIPVILMIVAIQEGIVSILVIILFWSSKKQRGVSRSNTEAEYRQLAYTAATLSWYRLRKVGVLLCILSRTNSHKVKLGGHESHNRHIEVDYHYVQEKAIRKELEVDHISSTDLLVDLLTKGLSTLRFCYLLSKLPVLCCPLSLQGRDKPC
ncbi:hypothetical protein L3X38_034989 [Prunus dulcis]|uniref:Uncharacterized protein n=1 Tax=Prunus dulcis TaxID=3755 RepID=A0AAD4YYE5_PRUDU|nr:hypothetical protein L3X38_034989 [Prunus dulcis]